MKKILLLFIISLTILPAAAKRLHSEAEYQAFWCDKRGGLKEYVLPDKTRVDCLLPNMAVEFDFANKWAECVGQAIYYGRMTGKQPACVLIMERGDKDIKYLKRLRKAAYKKGVNMRTFTIKPEQLHFYSAGFKTQY
jgi:hypothetical protein